MRYLNDLSYRGTNPLFYPHFPVSPKVKIQVLIIRYLQAYSQKVTKSGAESNTKTGLFVFYCRGDACLVQS